MKEISEGDFMLVKPELLCLSSRMAVSLLMGHPKQDTWIAS